MNNGKELTERIKHINDEFFDLDHEKRQAVIRLEFEKPSDIFDDNLKTKKPMLNDEFLNRIKSSFEYIPKKYKIDLQVKFDDLDGYKEEELHQIFLDNMLFEATLALRSNASRNKLAFSLLTVGVIFATVAVLLGLLWETDGPVKTILLEVIDIGAWVTIWECFHIILIDNKLARDLGRNIRKRYSSISFSKK